MMDKMIQNYAKQSSFGTSGHNANRGMLKKGSTTLSASTSFNTYMRRDVIYLSPIGKKNIDNAETIEEYDEETCCISIPGIGNLEILNDKFCRSQRR